MATGPKLVPPRTHALPPLFWSDDDDEAPRATPEAIELITVQRVTRGGDTETIDTTQPQSLPDTNALRERYGPGMYRLIGRSKRGTIVSRAVHTIGNAQPGAVHHTAAAAPEGPAAQPDALGNMLSILLAQLSQSIKQNNELAAALATSGNKSGEQLVAIVSEFSKARLVDQSDLFQTLLKSKSSGGGDTVAAYKEGMNKMLELLEAAQGDGDGDDPELKKIEAVVKGMEAFNKFKASADGKGVPTQ